MSKESSSTTIAIRYKHLASAPQSGIRKRSYFLASLCLLGIATSGLALVHALSPTPGVEAGVNLVPVLQQNAPEKYLAALSVVDESDLAATQSRIQTHVVVVGDTLQSLAERYAVTAESILLSNALGEKTTLIPGQKLLIPPQASMLYRVQAKDTLASVATHFNISAEAIIQATGTSLSDFLSSGQILVIPDEDTVAKQPTSEALALRSTDSKSAKSYAWPVAGYVGSPYGMRHGRPHKGIDIVGPIGSPVVSARSGVVIFAGWLHGGFGNAVDVLHGDGVVSRYAHLSRVLAKAGQTVERGQSVGARGCTGRCTGPHLHFEIHVGGRAVNPLSYLR
ncbi:MAG: M23 family metallopeptidase [Anaerolineae bacterium]|nr:M23 family metallopeptidase [Gloeobacterales cyanobacterium ES-bin-313]